MTGDGLTVTLAIVSYDRSYIFPNVEVTPNYNAAQKVQGAGDDVSGD